MLALLLFLATTGDAAEVSQRPDLTTSTRTRERVGEKHRTTSTPSSASPTSASSAKPPPTQSSSSTTALPTPLGSTVNVGHLTALPTIAGVAIPTIGVPNTANAPFMQKSSLPEGTFFIAVGAILLFMGACVLLWRAMIACSVNRNAKRAIKSSTSSYSEKTGCGDTNGGWAASRIGTGYNPASTISFHKNAASTISTEHLTSGGSPVRQHYRDSATDRSSAPPQALFFSPTAQSRDSSPMGQRASPYMPSGYYANPSSPSAAGAGNFRIASQTSPYVPTHHQRTSTQAAQVSWSTPPVSPAVPSRHARGGSRDVLLQHGRGNGSPTRQEAGVARHSFFNNAATYGNASRSSLMLGQSGNGSGSEPTSRAQSVHVEGPLEGDGYGRRERFR